MICLGARESLIVVLCFPLPLRCRNAIPCSELRRVENGDEVRGPVMIFNSKGERPSLEYILRET